MNENPKFIDGFLSELMATLSEDDGEIILRRINTERLMRMVVEEFAENHEDESIRILSDTRISGETDADILIQVDDYDILIQLVDAPNNVPVLDVPQLVQFYETLYANPSTVVLIAVWTTDDLASIALSVPNISHLIDEPNRVEDVLAKTKHLSIVLGEIINSQSKLWGTKLDTARKKPSGQIDAHKQFITEFEQAVVDECNRSYRFIFRKQAAKGYPSSDEFQMIEQCLKGALEGGTAEDLLRQLTNLRVRGEQ